MKGRARQRSYHVTKKSQQVSAVLDSMGGKFVYSEVPIYDTLDIERVFAVDTESLKTNHSPLSTLLTTIRYHDDNECIETPDGTGMLEKLCASICERFGEDAGEYASQTEQRPKKYREGSSRSRDGRRLKIPPVLSVWFNLAYDFGRLASDHPEILKSTMVGADSFRISIRSMVDSRLSIVESESDSTLDPRPSTLESSCRYEIEVVRMHFGSSSSFEWYIRDYDTNKIVRLLGLDLTGYWKTTLRAAAKAAGVVEKKDIPDDWYQRPREVFSEKEWSVFKEYAIGDVHTTLELYHATVSLLQGIDLRVVRKNGVIPPSAPGAAARIVFALVFDMHPELRKENGGKGYWVRPPTWVDQLGCDAYFGGRVFSNNPGIHKNMITLDIKSAYPYAMACLPDPIGAIYEFIPPKEYDHSMADSLTLAMADQIESAIGHRPSTGDVEIWQEFAGQYGVLEIDGEGLNDVNPAFRTHDLEHHRLKYVVGKFEKHAVTIPEVVIGVLLGILRVDRIHRGVIMRDGNGPCAVGYGQESDSPSGSKLIAHSRSFLREGIVKFFKNKNNKELPKVQRDTNKLMANSTYGKFVEVNERNFSIFDNLNVPEFEKGERVAKTITKVYAELGDIDTSMVDGRWSKDIYWGDSDEQRLKASNAYRRGVEKLPFDDDRSFLSVVEYVEALRYADVPRDESEHVHLSKFLRRFTRYRCGQYFMPHLASQVTGLTSAIVGLAATCLGAMQGDTDSVHLQLKPMADGRWPICKKDQLASELGLPGWDKFEWILSQAGYGQEIPGVPELGKWYCESDGGSVESVLCRPKVYSHLFADNSTKQAKHGFSSFPRVKPDDAEVTKRLSVVGCRSESETENRKPKTENEEREAIAKQLSALKLHDSIAQLTREHSVTYQSRPSPRKLRQAVKHGGIVGEFISREIELVFRQDPNTWVDGDGLVHWLTLDGQRYDGCQDGCQDGCEPCAMGSEPETEADTSTLTSTPETLLSQESTPTSCHPKLKRSLTSRRSKQAQSTENSEVVRKRRAKKKQSELEEIQLRQVAMYQKFIKSKE